MDIHWKDHFILKGDEKIDGIISSDPPVKPSYKNVTFSFMSYPIEDQVKKELIEFISIHNITGTGNITLLPCDLLTKLGQLTTYIGILYQNTKMIGVILSITIPVIQSKKVSTIYGLTTFLCVHSKLHNLGLGMYLISQMMYEGYNRGILSGYHIGSKPIGNNSIPLSMWYRPLDVKYLQSINFKLNCKGNGRLKYLNRIPNGYSIVQVDDNNIDCSYQYYLSQCGNYTFSYNPTRDQWIQWIRAFRTYLMYEKGIIGIFSINTMEMMTYHHHIKLSTLLLYHGHDITLKGVINKSSGHLLYGYICGHINPSMIENIRGWVSPNPCYLSFYNSGIRVIASDIFVPIL